MVEHLVVAQVVEGSSPFTHPILSISARSSAGQSAGLRIRRPQVRILPGVPLKIKAPGKFFRELFFCPVIVRYCRTGSSLAYLGLFDVFFYSFYTSIMKISCHRKMAKLINDHDKDIGLKVRRTDMSSCCFKTSEKINDPEQISLNYNRQFQYKNKL